MVDHKFKRGKLRTFSGITLLLLPIGILFWNNGEIFIDIIDTLPYKGMEECFLYSGFPARDIQVLLFDR